MRERYIMAIQRACCALYRSQVRISGAGPE